MGPYNRGYIAASRQANFYCVRQPWQPQYRLQIVVPGNQVAAKHNSRDIKLFKITFCIAAVGFNGIY